MKKLIIITLVLAAAGCSTLRKSDSAAFQGTWQGKEIGIKTDDWCFVVVSGDTAEFRGADTNEWYKASFTLREDTDPKQIVCLTTDCSYPPLIGKRRYGIYRIEEGTIRLSINEADNPVTPAAFDAPRARQFEFRRK